LTPFFLSIIIRLYCHAFVSYPFSLSLNNCSNFLPTLVLSCSVLSCFLFILCDTHAFCRTFLLQSYGGGHEHPHGCHGFWNGHVLLGVYHCLHSTFHLEDKPLCSPFITSIFVIYCSSEPFSPPSIVCRLILRLSYRL
jgi:hypothetical protein